MRDKRFVTEHRGGPLTKTKHKLLILWACKCVEHILPIYGRVPKEINNALQTAKLWSKDQATVGDARNCAFALLKIARTLKDEKQIAIIRATHHCVATAHMADHSTGAAEYALKALAIVGKDIEKERIYQNKILPKEIRILILETRAKNKKFWESSIKNVLKKIKKETNQIHNLAN